MLASVFDLILLLSFLSLLWTFLLIQIADGAPVVPVSRDRYPNSAPKGTHFEMDLFNAKSPLSWDDLAPSDAVHSFAAEPSRS